MTIYLICIEYSSEPATILGASCDLDRAQQIAGAYHDPKHPSVGDVVIYAIEDGKDYDWNLPEKIPLKA